MFYSKLTAKIALSLSIIFLFSGCASFGRGIAEALVKPKPTNYGECNVYSGGIKGINAMFDENEGKIHILMIHGIGQMSTGYARIIAEKLADNVGLDIKAKKPKTITLKSNILDGEIGQLRVYHFWSDDNKTREMFLYEYTWSSIIEPVKNQLRFDTTEALIQNRTLLANTIKSFINQRGTDAIIYLTNKDAAAHITDGVAQTFCWMTTESWMDIEDLDTNGQSCIITPTSKPRRKNYITLTHSLGSQIAIDTLQGLADGSLGHNPITGQTPEYVKTYPSDTHIEIYMLANQLPMIATGKQKPQITNKIANYCGNNAPDKNIRMIQELEVIAISDPNDVLSYKLPARFEEQHIDSRLCPDVSNIIVNVAPLSDLFGMQVANPFTAHSNYQKDKRIIDFISYGTVESDRQKNPKEGCHWIKEVLE